MNLLADKTMIVTGAAHGIGAHLTALFLQAGARVVACDIDENNLKALYGSKSNCSIQVADVSNYADWKKVFKNVNQLDYLFNVAGVIRPGHVESASRKDIDLQLDVNLKGTVYGTRLAVKMMSQQGRGHIVNFASMAGIAPIEGISIYSASKFGVRGFTLALAHELKKKNIHVSLVCPDAVETSMLEDQMHSSAAALTFSGSRILTVEEVGRVVMNKVVKQKQQEVWIPFDRGLLAYLGSTFPRFASVLSSGLMKKGLKQQEKFRNER